MLSRAQEARVPEILGEFVHEHDPILGTIPHEDDLLVRCPRH